METQEFGILSLTLLVERYICTLSKATALQPNKVSVSSLEGDNEKAGLYIIIPVITAS